MPESTSHTTSPEDCPTPIYHETHHYCPSCSWVNEPTAFDDAMAAAAQLGAALARLQNAILRMAKEREAERNG